MLYQAAKAPSACNPFFEYRHECLKTKEGTAETMYLVNVHYLLGRVHAIVILPVAILRLFACPDPARKTAHKAIAVPACGRRAGGGCMRVNSITLKIAGMIDYVLRKWAISSLHESQSMSGRRAYQALTFHPIRTKYLDQKTAQHPSKRRKDLLGWSGYLSISGLVRQRHASITSEAQENERTHVHIRVPQTCN